MHVDRRELLKAASGFALFAGLPLRGVLAQAPRQYPFTLGIAAGDPAPDGFVIWTRLAPRPLEPHGGMAPQPVAVGWEVAEDRAFSRIVQSGEAIARPELGHSVHVEVGGLRPARPYHYRFIAGAEFSDTGIARTTPAQDAAVDRLRIGVAGCQRYTSGYFTAYRHLAAEGDLDAIFHYGDYIYEGGARRGCAVVDGQTVCVREHDSDEIYSLDDYRHRYALYKLDPDLQAAHRAAAFLPTFDDHEVDNNWAGQWDESGTPAEVFLLRRFVALQAWYENMPVRRAQFPANGQLRMFRRIDYGNLLRIHLLDTRQYRSDQRCNMPGDRNCRPADDSGPESVLGDEQEAWLRDGMGGDRGWNLLAQQVMMMPFRYPAPTGGPALYTNNDSWSGYPQARQRVRDMIQERRLTNVVVATGDVHKHHAGVIPSSDADLLSKPVATEYVGSSISSDGDGSDMPAGWEQVPAANPHVALHNSRRGYQLFDIRREEWRTDVMTVDRVSVKDGRLSRVASLVTVPQKPGIERA